MTGNTLERTEPNNLLVRNGVNVCAADAYILTV